MPHALLLSPDDQAVSAITGVLEEMSVSCERPLDGSSAAQKLRAQSFDLVLVDCENLPAAKLIFDVCRRSKTGTSAVPIAIVDGRAGLPTAFRLGAELILTKPVSKDQARSTIRTAVSRLRKEEPTRTVQPVETPAVESRALAPPEPRVQIAAAAAAAAPQPAMSVAAAPPPAPIAPTLAETSEAAKEIVPEPESPKPEPAFSLASEPPVTPGDSAIQKPAPKTVSDDHVWAELERAEAELQPSVFSAYAQPKQKGRGLQVALLLLLLAGGGFYAAWTYQPDFRTMVEPYVTKVLALLAAPGPQPASSAQQQDSRSPRQAPTPSPAKTPATAAQPTAGAAADQTTANAAPPGVPNGAVPPAQSTLAPTTNAATPVSQSAQATEAAQPKDNTVADTTFDSELPGEKNAIVLSSKGAERRLIHHVPPVYPATARPAGTEGTVVLKTLVSEDGKVEAVRVVEGNTTLTAAAVKAVKQWRYRPYVRDGRAQPFRTIVLVDFQRP